MTRQSEKVTVTVEWAVWGKGPEDRGFSLLSCSDGRFGEDDFTDILKRYSPGTLEEYPQVTLSWAGSGESNHVGIAFHEVSEARDKLGREYAVTRYFCVPYAQLKKRPVSYLALYEALKEIEVPDGKPFEVQVEPLRPDLIGQAVTEQVMSTAAVLLSSRLRVCIVGAEELTVAQKLCHLDLVAAMLPYGMRSKFSASTWTSSTAAHNIRLSFTDEERPDAVNIIWPGYAPVTPGPGAGGHYLALLVRHARRDDLVGRLAAATHPLDFTQGSAAVAVLDGSYEPSQIPEPPLPAAKDDAEKLLRRCADALEHKRTDQMSEHLGRLGYVKSFDYSDDQRRQFQAIVKDRRMLMEKLPVNADQRAELYDGLLQLAYGPVLTSWGLDAVADAVGGGRIHTPLLMALRRMPCEEPRLLLWIGLQAGDKTLRETFDRLTDVQLIDAIWKEDTESRLFEPVLEELISRGGAGNDLELATALEMYGYLCHPLERHYVGDNDRQHKKLVSLLRAAYGDGFGLEQLEHVLGGRPVMPTVALFTAAVSLCPGGARDAVVDLFLRKVVERAYRSSRLRDDLLLQLATPSSPTPAHPQDTEVAPYSARHDWLDKIFITVIAVFALILVMAALYAIAQVFRPA